MALHIAFFDESGKKDDHPVVTFAGVCARQDRLQAFNEQWKALLGQYGITSLHMKDASDLKKRVGSMNAGQSFPERTNALIPFADCINEHLELGLIQAWDVKGFLGMDQKVKDGVGNPSDPYYLAFARAVAELVDHVPADDRIELICDHDSETAAECELHYQGMSAAAEQIRLKVISLSFADDELFPALQAADLVAYLSRREARFMFYGQNYGFRPLFDHMTKRQAPGKMNWQAMFANERSIKALLWPGTVDPGWKGQTE